MSKPHALEQLIATMGTGDPHANLSFRVNTAVSHLNLRGNPDDAHFLAAAQDALGQPLPTQANTFSKIQHRIYWLGPNEWHIVSTSPARELLDALEVGLQDISNACNNLSGGYVDMTLSGENVRDVLAKGCTIDLHPNVFQAGHCAQTNLAKAIVLIGCTEDRDSFDLLVRRSFAEYVCLWIAQASQPEGWSLTVV